MPTDGKSLEPYGNLYLIGEDEVPFTVGKVGSLSLDESEDGSWSATVGVAEWEAVIETEIPWMNRMLYIIGARRQRKTALERRRARRGKT